MLDVEFEWFDPQPEHDFHGLKTLLRQLFDVDAQLFDLSALTDLILAQPLLGSTVKVEGNETDPYAFLTVLNLNEHKVVLQDASYQISSNRLVGQASHSAIDQLHPDTNQAGYGHRTARPTFEHFGQYKSRACVDRKTHQYSLRGGPADVQNATGGNLLGD